MTAKSLQLLLVEDDPADAELTTLALRKHNLVTSMEIARDGAEALDFLFCRGDFQMRSFENPPRLVLLDLKLPRVSGHQVLRTVKSDSRTRAIPVVILTSSNLDTDIALCYALGANSYIQKPSALHEFQETVRQFGAFWLRINQPPPISAFRESP
jgi:two-component system, response regulator